MTAAVPTSFEEAKTEFFGLCDPRQEGTVIAITDAQVDRMAQLLDAYPELINAKKDECTPLIKVANNENSKACLLLLERGAEVNAQGVADQTALHLAASWQQLDNCRLLLKHGANPNIKNKDGDKTPLHEAVNWDHSGNIARVMLWFGADPTITDHLGHDAFARGPMGERTQLENWIRKWQAGVDRHFNGGKPTHRQCFVKTDHGEEILSDPVLDACATGLFAPVIAMPLIESTNPADRQLFKDIWNALPKHWQGQHQNIYMVFAKAGGLQPVLGAHTADACTPHGTTGRAL